jgi:hypothetical protein
MGMHLCALSNGEHCPKGLVCLGCTHAQPKKSAVPVFRRVLASDQRSLVAPEVITNLLVRAHSKKQAAVISASSCRSCSSAELQLALLDIVIPKRRWVLSPSTVGSSIASSAAIRGSIGLGSE